MMKKILAAIGFILAVQFSFAQQLTYDWKSMKPEQRKEVIQKMNPNERKALLKEFREKMIVSELGVSQNSQPEFLNLYTEYQNKQNEIKSKFSLNENYDTMSDEEATKQLNQSFEVGQQLLDNRKNYAQKFIKVISPQQVLKMYQTEGRMRNKILDKKEDGSRNSGTQRRR
ncbi:hypothetical protein PUH65_02680 [Kaistella sp. SH40-3]|uniref:hypothetical protein n=2 Tax=Kaistella TaxID=2782231 RepID=UPI0027365628|nr:MULTISPECIES: hypothetical protein [unclassified Kaistella]MCZ2084414.1 hypothetical protein [Flavobacteriales bacterium]MDP2455921.1 hypothetical protein [Kaistella sp. SH40-3]MDP2458825.1 hypothetical protein [Kaistella sp. SH19-2b]